MRVINDSVALEKLQQEELGILVEFSRFCKSHDLVWFLDSGTALGAARHKGFIPWDDDIDVGMPRSDYEKFLRLTESNREISPGYSVHTFSNTANYAAMFAKVYRDGTVFATKETIGAGCEQGIFIDVFPYDRISENLSAAKKAASRAHRWQVVSYLYHTPNLNVLHPGALRLLEHICFSLAHRLTRSFLSRDRILAGYKSAIGLLKEGRYISYAYPVLPGFSEEVLFPVADCDFCGYVFPGPHKMEEYLTLSYGDWKKLPDPNDRKTHLPVKLVFSDGSGYER